MTPQPPPDAPQLPPNLPPLPPVPDGFDHWEYRGLGWNSPSKHRYAFLCPDDKEWNVYEHENYFPSGVVGVHYIEAVKSSPAVPVKAGEVKQTPAEISRALDDGILSLVSTEPPVTDSQRPDKSFMDQFSPDQRNLMDALQDIADLKAELAAAKQDGERLEWLLAHLKGSGWPDTRAEIDDAMREGEGV